VAPTTGVYRDTCHVCEGALYVDEVRSNSEYKFVVFRCTRCPYYYGDIQPIKESREAP